VATAVILGIAGEHAAARSLRPGTFAVALLDELDAINADSVRTHGRLSVL
jgi:hydroxyethylthiazole kinase